MCGTVAEELAESFFMVRNAMFFDESDEVRGRVPGQRGFREMFVRTDEIFRLAMNVGEITAPAAGDENLLANSIGKLEHGDTPATFAGFDRAEKSRGAGAKDKSVKFLRQE